MDAGPATCILDRPSPRFGTTDFLGRLNVSTIRQTSFDIVHRLRQAGTCLEVMTELRSAGDAFGYDSFLIGGLPQGPEETLRACALISGWPEGWSRHYEENGYLHVDPVIAHIRQTADPFLWRDAPRPVGDARAARVMDEAPAFGLAEGFCVPFHEVDGSEAGVSFGAGRLDLPGDARAGLHLVAIYAFAQARALLQPPEPPTRRKPRLTAREIECLKWASAGKTDWETSVILALSARTVELHIRNATRKLNAVNRVQGIAQALRLHIIG